jgi:hypothetical protein
MEIKESIAQEAIYNLSVMYKVLLGMGVFLFISSIFMALLYLLEPNISAQDDFISESTLQKSFAISALLTIAAIIFRFFRNIVRVKTRPFRTKRSKR